MKCNIVYPLYRIYDSKFIWYDPIVGTVNVPTHLSAGKYLCFKCNNKSIKVHIFAFYFMNGVWPREYIDHIDENKTNNKWNNLRELDSSNNQLRSSTKRKSNTSRWIGVSLHKQNKNWFWHLQVKYNSKREYGYRCPTVAAIMRDKYIISNGIKHGYKNIL